MVQQQQVTMEQVQRAIGALYLENQVLREQLAEMARRVRELEEQKQEAAEAGVGQD